MKDHLNHSDEEDGGQSNGTWHGRIVLVPETAKAGITEREEGRGKQMNKSRSDENAGTEVADGKEEAAWDSQAWELGGQNRKRAAQRRDKEDDEDSSDMKRKIVVFLVNTTLGAGASLAEGRDGVGNK